MSTTNNHILSAYDFQEYQAIWDKLIKLIKILYVQKRNLQKNSKKILKKMSEKAHNTATESKRAY